MLKPAFFLSFIILGVIAFVLFEVEYRVDSLRSQFSEVNHQLLADREAIHVLKAEWSYLNQPERLKKLSSRYLALESVSSELPEANKSVMTLRPVRAANVKGVMNRSAAAVSTTWTLNPRSMRARANSADL